MGTATLSDARRAYGGRTADERDAERRARLLKASLEVIGCDGYAATTVERICTTASVSTRHFYQLYATKEDAFIDVYRGINEDSATRVATALARTSDEPLPSRIAKAFVSYLEPMLADQRVARIAFVEIVGVSPRVEQVRLAFREQLIALVEAEGTAAVARGEIADRDFRFATLALAGAATAVVYDWMINPSGRSLEHLQQSLAELAITLLAA